MGSVYINMARRRQSKILHGASRKKWMGNIQSDSRIINSGLTVGAGLNRHDVSRVIVFVNCELKLRGRQFLGRLINYSRKTSHHEVRYF